MHARLRTLVSVSLPSFLLGLTLGGVGIGLAALRGSAVFTDVPAGSYYDEAVGEMYAAGVIKGYDSGKFGPNDYVTRGQVAVMMQRFRDNLTGVVSSSSSSRQSSSSSSSTSSSSSSTSSSSSSSSSVSSSINGAFRFSNAVFSIPETVSSLTLSVTRAGGSTGDVTVTYTVKGGTATAGSDFTEVPSGQLRFADGETSKTFTISIKDDSLGEGSETVLLELKDPTGGSVIGSPGNATLTILDNEAPGSASSSAQSSSVSSVAGAGVLEFSAAGYEIAENAGSLSVIVTRTNGTSGQVAVTYATSDKTGKAGTDYASTSGTLTFAGGESSKTFSIPIIDDSSVDGKKTFGLTLSAPTGGAGLGTNVSVTVGIPDNESAAMGSGTFLFSRSSYQVTEGDGKLNLIVNRVGGSQYSATVGYFTTNGSAISGSDYTSANGSLTFLPGESSKLLTISVARDSTADSGEYFTASLQNPSGAAALGDPSVATVTIYE